MVNRYLIEIREMNDDGKGAFVLNVPFTFLNSL
jgi:hypothetical protein